MDLEHFCNTLGISRLNQCNLESCWEKVCSSLDGMPFFLDLEYFKTHYPLIHAKQTLDEVLPFAEEVIRITEKNPELALAAHVICRICFMLESNISSNIFPDQLPFLGEKYSGMFSLMITMGIYPFVRKAYAELGLPEKYADDMMKWIGGTMPAYEQAHPGIPGRPLQFVWLRNYVEKKLFRIGRLEYLAHPCREWVPLIYRSARGELAVLCNEKWNLRNEKYTSITDDDIVFTSALYEDEHSITGTPILPDGTVETGRTRTLDKREWTPAVTPWDLCPSIHIPGGGKMSFEDIKSSMLEAAAFFERYFHRRVPLFCCCSWILNPAWEDLLENSNMARFRQECYAAPGTNWGRWAGMSFLFGVAKGDPAELPLNNSAQRAFAEAYRTGRIGTGVIFVLREDIPHLGSQFYRKNCR